ncbi:cytochrome P450 [Dactylosporangium sp. NPDC051484]|uniref:cytochrome P450 n=1 Tax=Dactylosporangium sp. NPDC051484 TaxID=3154942 RepID=UPI00344B18D3
MFWDDRIGGFVFTRYDHIVEILTNPKVFSSKHMLKHRPIPEELAEYFPDGHPGLHSLTFMDNPRHGRIRRLANQAFTPRRIAELEPVVSAIANRLIDTFQEKGEADLLAEFTAQLPMLLMRHIAGATEETDLDFTSWGPDYFALTESAPPLTHDRIEQIGAKSGRILKWMREYVELRRAKPGDDFISSLIEARTPEGDTALSTTEVVGVLSAMLSAGIETTAHFLPQLLRHLLSDPNLLELVKADRGRIRPVIEEALRIYPASRGMRRTALEDVEVGGVLVPAGTDVFVYLISANFDDGVFPAPHVFSDERPNGERHLSFGRGTHFCIGAPLARLEIRVALNLLLDRLPGLRLDPAEPGPEGAVDWEPNLTVPRLKHFYVKWDAAAIRSDI